jgi:hypothetical protein
MNGKDSKFFRFINWSSNLTQCALYSSENKESGCEPFHDERVYGGSGRDIAQRRIL